MSTNTTEHATDWDEQRERLSAYLDRQLAPAEQSALERHIAGCARCTAELAELRQLMTLLHALPAPQMPRSFVLPIGVVARPATVHVAPPQGGQAARPARWTSAVQWAGGLAAAAGIVLLLGAALVGLSGHVASTTSMYAPAARQAPIGNGASSARSMPTQRDASNTPAAGGSQTNGAGTPTSAATSTPPQNRVAGGPVPTRATEGPTASEELLLTGGGLLVGGAVVFAVARRARRHAA